MGKLPAKRPSRKRIQSPFGENLKRILKEKGMTLRQAANICGVNQAVIHAWQQGGMPHDLTAVLKLCQVLKVDFQWLLTGTQGSVALKEASLSQIFDIEDDPTFSGLFLLEAKKLKRKS